MQDPIDAMKQFENATMSNENVDCNITKPGENAKKYKNDWKNMDLEALPIDVDALDRSNRTFAFFTNQDTPEQIIGDAIEVADALFRKFFTFRQTGETLLEPVMRIETAANKRIETYLPWKTSNKAAVNVAVGTPTKESHQTAMTLFGQYVFSKEKGLNPTIRNFLARNTHIFLGKDLNVPLNLVIIYSSDGCQSKSTIDFKTTGRMQSIIEAAEALKIPIFNLGNPTGKESVLKYVSTL